MWYNKPALLPNQSSCTDTSVVHLGSPPSPSTSRTPYYLGHPRCKMVGISPCEYPSGGVLRLGARWRTLIPTMDRRQRACSSSPGAPSCLKRINFPKISPRPTLILQLSVSRLGHLVRCLFICCPYSPNFTLSPAWCCRNPPQQWAEKLLRHGRRFLWGTKTIPVLQWSLSGLESLVSFMRSVMVSILIPTRHVYGY